MRKCKLFSLVFSLGITGGAAAQGYHFVNPVLLPAPPGGGVLVDAVVNPNGHLTVTSVASSFHTFWSLDPGGVYTQLGAPRPMRGTDVRHLPGGEVLYYQVIRPTIPLSVYPITHALVRMSDFSFLISATEDPFNPAGGTSINSHIIQHDRDGYPIWRITGTHSGSSMSSFVLFLDSRDGNLMTSTGIPPAVAAGPSEFCWRPEGREVLSLATAVDNEIRFTALDVYPETQATAVLPAGGITILRFIDLVDRRVVVYRQDGDFRAVTLWQDGTQQDALLYDDTSSLSASRDTSAIGGEPGGEVRYIQNTTSGNSPGPIILARQSPDGRWTVETPDTAAAYAVRIADTDTIHPGSVYTVSGDPDIHATISVNSGWVRSSIVTDKAAPPVYAAGRDASGRFLVVYGDNSSSDTLKMTWLSARADTSGWAAY